MNFLQKFSERIPDAGYEEVGYGIMEEFGDLYGAFEIGAEEGAKPLIERGMSEEWANAITEVAKKNISPP